MSDVSKFLEEQADILASNLKGWELNVLKRIGRRINAIGKMSIADIQSLNNAAFVKRDLDIIFRELAIITGKNIKDIERIYGEALEKQNLDNVPLYDYRNKEFISLSESIELQAMVRAYSKATGKNMINLSKTKALGVIDNNGNFIHLQKAYTDVLDKAVMQASSGATDFNTAMRDSIKMLGGSGVRVDYGGGVTRRLDTAVRQSILYGAKQVSIEYNEMIGEVLDCDGIEIDWHSYPRPTHEFMQGKQYAVGEAITVNGKYFESAGEARDSESGKNVIESLADYNCNHYKTPIICGISQPRYTDKELEELNQKNKKEFVIDGVSKTGYGWSQSMRRLETAAREQKTIKVMAEASGDNELVKQCNDKIKAIEKKYNTIAKGTGIKAQPQKMAIVRDNNLQNGLKNNSNSGIINAGAVSGAKKTDGWEGRHAEQMYEEIRHRTTDVKKISESTNFKESAVEEIKQHMFFRQHKFANGAIKCFDSDFDQAQAWDRLTQGRGTETDIVMLKHEYVELIQMRLKDLCYEDAHAIANKKHNWGALLDKE